MSTPETVQYVDNAANLQSDVSAVARIQEGLAHIGVERVDEQVARQLIDTATPESAVTALDYINAAVNGAVERADHSEATSVVSAEIDGKEVVGQVLLPPRHRADFMSYALEKAKTTDSISRKANILAYGTVLAHNFADGNGRTARVLAGLVAEGFDPNSPESVANIARLATSRELLEKRPASFAPNFEMKRSWIAGEMEKNDQVDASQNAQQQIIKHFVTEKTDGSSRYVDPDKLDAALEGIPNEKVRGDLSRVLQQNEFGMLAMADILALTGVSDAPEALSMLSEADAVAMTEKDEDRKLAYSKYIIDIAAGEPQSFYTAYGATAQPGALTDQYMIGYH